MPKGNRGSRGDNPLRVRYKGRLQLSGPASEEDNLRNTLERTIANLLAECPRFAKTRLPDHYAFKIVWNAPFRFTGPDSTPIARILDLTVVYRNKAEWKDWLVIRDGETEFVATGEGRISEDYDE